MTKPKKVTVHDVTTIPMVVRNERRISKVILNDNLLEWVGIGWITLRKATAEDKRKYPEVADEQDRPGVTTHLGQTDRKGD